MLYAFLILVVYFNPFKPCQDPVRYKILQYDLYFFGYVYN